MARPLRLEFPGALYHVMSRGDKKENIFFAREDQSLFLSLLSIVSERFAWKLHAYCLMNNHYHLLVETPLGNLSKGMHYLNGVYTQKFNRAYDRVGHVFQGRYKAIFVEKDSYLLELARYIVLNPVRAHLVQAPFEWEWSSYRATCNMARQPKWLAIDTILSMFSSSRSQAILQYKQFVEEGRLENPWNDLKNQLYLGSDSFVEKMMKHISPEKDCLDIPKPQYTQSVNIRTLEEYERTALSRNDGIKAAFNSGAYTLKQIGDHFHLHYSRISKIVNADKTKKSKVKA